MYRNKGICPHSTLYNRKKTSSHISIANNIATLYAACQCHIVCNQFLLHQTSNFALLLVITGFILNTYDFIKLQLCQKFNYVRLQHEKTVQTITFHKLCAFAVLAVHLHVTLPGYIILITWHVLLVLENLQNKNTLSNS